MSKRPSYYITTAISYVNGLPHLGHAYEAISADAMARFKRLDGYNVFFLTGTDEHGQKVEKSAIEAGEDPLIFCDGNADAFRQMTHLLNISNDDFIRTTEQRHIRASQSIWNNLWDAGDIYLGKYAGWYSVRDEAYFEEAELVIDPDDPKKKIAPSGASVEWVEEPSYFFKLSSYTQPLLDYYEANPEFILPESRKNEIINFVKQGLRDLSISRTTFKWGVPVPSDEAHIMYVWLDALTNYITALGFPDKSQNINKDSEVFTMETHWPADLHIIGKDIVRFHAVYWPAFLMSANLPVPKRIFGHGFLNVEGEKMSKSLGNVISAQDLVEEFGLDEIRYFLLREVPYGQDGSFSRESIIQRINADLANDLGNLAQRCLSFIYKNCDGAIPFPGEFNGDDKKLLESSIILLSDIRNYFEKQAFHNGLEVVWGLVSECNIYIDRQAPWGLREKNPERMKTVLYIGAEVIRRISIMIQPVMPTAGAKLLDQLGVPDKDRHFKALNSDIRVQPGAKILKPEGVFPRFVEK